MFLGSKIPILQDRAAMFKAVRLFFEERGVLEVDTPMLSKAAPIDAHIDILETKAFHNQIGYLHSSPEYGMKKLLAMGLSDIFQLSHVYRQGELSSKHQVEFSMIEWYRSSFSLSELLQETLALIFLFTGKLPYEIVRYDLLLQSKHPIDPLNCSLQELKTYCSELGLQLDSTDRDVYLSFLWDLAEVDLGRGKITCVTHFPATQAALSRIVVEEGISYASRFECYAQGLELANGYHELTDPTEQRARLLEQNSKRISLNKPELPIDEKFLEALHHLKSQDFFGVAVGFDRLMMLRHNTEDITHILPLSWEEV